MAPEDTWDYSNWLNLQLNQWSTHAPYLVTCLLLPLKVPDGLPHEEDLVCQGCGDVAGEQLWLQSHTTVLREYEDSWKMETNVPVKNNNKGNRVRKKDVRTIENVNRVSELVYSSNIFFFYTVSFVIIFLPREEFCDSGLRCQPPVSVSQSTYYDPTLHI